MAHSVSAKKRIRQNARHRARNRWRKGILREALKDFEAKFLHGSEAEAKSAFEHACKVLDKTAAKGVIHKNNAARRKSRLAKRMKARSA